MPGTSIALGQKRSGHSPHANGTGVRRLGPSPPSMIVLSGVTHSPDNSQKSSPLTPTNSAKQLPAPAPNSASNVPFLWLLQMLQAPLPLLLLALLCRTRIVWGTLLELQWVPELLLTLVDVQ